LRTQSLYPASPSERDAWIVAQRPARKKLDPAKPFAFFVEQERDHSGELVDVATIFLTNRECPWKCVFCDLWKNTVAERTPIGAIPSQIEYALSRLPPARQIKLYNSGSFFDRRAIPSEDRPRIAERVAHFERVVVECHPNLANDEVLEFRDALRGTVEVAVGLETTHPEVLEKLNKRVTLEQFALAAEFLNANGISLRVFVLVQPPFIPIDEAAHWARRSIDFAVDCGAGVCSLIPTRAGNGALDALAALGQFSEPSLEALEEATEYGVGLKRGRVFADLWDLERFSSCEACFPQRLRRLREMNHTQQVIPRVSCGACARS
jgi:archaeosine synthase beta-subunit